MWFCSVVVITPDSDTESLRILTRMRSGDLGSTPSKTFCLFSLFFYLLFFVFISFRLFFNHQLACSGFLVAARAYVVVRGSDLLTELGSVIDGHCLFHF
jgi:hypothetical protein